MEKTQTQGWFLLKKNWMKELEDLSNEEFGLLVRNLFNSETPQGHLKMIYGLLKDEFDRVNTRAEQAKEQRQAKAAKAAQARWGDAKGVLKHTEAILDDAKNAKNTMLEHTEAVLRDAGTETETETITNTVTITKKNEVNNSLNSLKDSGEKIKPNVSKSEEWLESFPDTEYPEDKYDGLSKGQIADLIFSE